MLPKIYCLKQVTREIFYLSTLFHSSNGYATSRSPLDFIIFTNEFSYESGKSNDSFNENMTKFLLNLGDYSNLKNTADGQYNFDLKDERIQLVPSWRSISVSCLTTLSSYLLTALLFRQVTRRGLQITNLEKTLGTVFCYTK